MNKHKCIYCLEEKTLAHYKKTEHIIPQSFGRFKNNLVLNTPQSVYAVCDECNQYFGNELELFLARDTFEGMIRYSYGLKPTKDFKFDKKRIVSKLDEGNWKGAYIEVVYSKDEGRVVINPVSQMGLRRKDDGKYDYFIFEGLKDVKYYKKRYDLEHIKGIKCLFNKNEKDRILELLKEKGFKISLDGDIYQIDAKPGQKVRVEISKQIDKHLDRKVLRVVAKIVFNYLVYNFGIDFALNKNFNDLRNYVRFNVKSSNAFVEFQKKEVLSTERRLGQKRTNGHMITLEWDAFKHGIISQFTLFNMTTFKVVLCKDYKGVYWEFKRGHHFNMHDKIITEMTGISKSIMIPF